MAFTPDAQYLADAALRAFNRRQKLSELDTQSSQGRQDLQTMIRRLGEQRVKAVQSTRQGANKQGLFYSGQLGKQLGDVNKSYAQQQGDARQQFNRDEAARQAARTAIEAGAPLEEASAAAAATDRQIQRDQDAASANGLVPNQPASTGAASRPAATPKTVKPKAPPKPRVQRPRARRVGVPRFGAGARVIAQQRQAQPRR